MNVRRKILTYKLQMKCSEMGCGMDYDMELIWSERECGTKKFPSFSNRTYRFCSKRLALSDRLAVCVLGVLRSILRTCIVASVRAANHQPYRMLIGAENVLHFCTPMPSTRFSGLWWFEWQNCRTTCASLARKQSVHKSHITICTFSRRFGQKNFLTYPFAGLAAWP